MDTSPYLLLKTLHLVGVVLFLGNIVVTGWWKVMADRTRHPQIVAFAQRQVTLTDWVFTAGGATLLAIGGLGNAHLHGLDHQHVRWLAWGYWSFMVSGVLWVAVLIPVQVQQARLARAFADGDPIPERYWQLGRIWMTVGSVATVIPFTAIWWMVVKPVA
ncbi:DUF2269 domain-containing protein [Aquabacterium sp.]|jgi:uncharacterized membrane protein|uniref:DUF2269 family protein n=1 Tax=Aquabacterium sp. TaxID=1872578 RepID=UPI0025BFC852|nr:DUF2269 domain-containing protein [Aquabacterium sp.]